MSTARLSKSKIYIYLLFFLVEDSLIITYFFVISMILRLFDFPHHADLKCSSATPFFIQSELPIKKNRPSVNLSL